jgi:hypothetical protein
MFKRLIEVRRNVYSTQTKGCWGAIHVGMTVLYLGWDSRRKGSGWRLELCTPFRKFRWAGASVR